MLISYPSPAGGAEAHKLDVRSTTQIGPSRLVNTRHSAIYMYEAAVSPNLSNLRSSAVMAALLATDVVKGRSDCMNMHDGRRQQCPLMPRSGKYGHP